MSGGRCARSRRQSCAARCRRRRRRCPQSCGHQCPARCGAKCGRAPQERPHECGEHCAGWGASRCAANPTPGDTRRRTGAPGRAGGDARSRRSRPGRARRGQRRVRREAPSRGERSERPASCRELRHGVACSSASGARSERQRAEATGIAAEIGAKRRLQRKARPRSGSPRLFVWIPVPASIIDTIDTITVCTLVVSIRCMVTSSTGIPGISIDEIATIVGPNTGNVIGAHRTLSSSVARR